MNLFDIVKRLVLASLFIALAACAGDNVDDLRDFVAEVKAKPGKKIDPIPTYPPYRSYTYQVMTMRAPFTVPVKVKPVSREQMAATDVKPDENRAKEFLEGFQLESLKMVGTLSIKGVITGLMSDNSGAVHPISVGNFVGKSHGRVVEIYDNQVDIVEIIPNGAGSWVERPRVIKLRESK
jgi:type IV pilus assembly protein PilP